MSSAAGLSGVQGVLWGKSGRDAGSRRKLEFARLGEGDLDLQVPVAVLETAYDDYVASARTLESGDKGYPEWEDKLVLEMLCLAKDFASDLWARTSQAVDRAVALRAKKDPKFRDLARELVAFGNRTYKDAAQQDAELTAEIIAGSDSTREGKPNIAIAANRWAESPETLTAGEEVGDEPSDRGSSYSDSEDD